MSDFKWKDKKIIACVAQRPFEGDTGTFCKLIPVFNHLDENEPKIDPAEFPNDGQIHCRIGLQVDPTRYVPGMLMEIRLTLAQERSSFPDKSHYQAAFGKVEDVIDITAGSEIFPLEGPAEKLLTSLKGAGCEFYLLHCPAKRIYLKIEDFIYGPFSTDISRLDDNTPAGYFTIRATPLNTAAKASFIYRLKVSDFMARYQVLRNEAEITLESEHVMRAVSHARVSYEYLTPRECTKIASDFNSVWEKLDWEPLSDKLSRMAKSIHAFTRGDVQKLRELIKTMESSQEITSFAQEFKVATANLKKLCAEEDLALHALAHELMQAQVMCQERLNDLIEKEKDRYLSDHKTELEGKLATETELFNEAHRKREKEENELKKARTQKQSELKKLEDNSKKQIEKEKAKASKEIEEAKQKWNNEKGQLEANLKTTQRKLEAVRDEIKAHTEKGAADMIALLPFLKEMNWGGPSAPVPVSAPTHVVVESSATQSKVEPFAFPASIFVPSPAIKATTSQEAFLTRLRDYTLSEGLSFDRTDLRRFHVSVLCEELSVLEGPSGVGKSSLARLYGEVLAGRQALPPRDGTHLVHVSPSWVERADLLGYVNTITGEFSPSETGLYQRLICAEQDYLKNKTASALYPICLDEMNLAQVEHYFSDFMQILELPPAKRRLDCFSKDAVLAHAVFREHASVTLPPTLRFIGTVNFDETTKRLSSRLLDRVNLIYLNENMRTVSEIKKVDAGEGISFATYLSWQRTEPLSKKVEKLLTDLSEPLRKLGVVISPRVHAAMARYIATDKPLIGSGEKAEMMAFDEQLAQRVLSKVRAITSMPQRKAIESVSQILDGISDDASPSRALIARLRAREHFLGYENEG